MEGGLRGLGPWRGSYGSWAMEGGLRGLGP